MWDLSIPWFEIVSRAVMIFFALFFLFKVWRKKTIAELSTFDFVILIIMGGALQKELVKDDHSLGSGFIVVLTFMILSSLLSWVSFYSRRAEKFLEGTPKVIIRDGKIMYDVLKKEKISLPDLLESIRESGVVHLNDIGISVLEANGKISVIRKEHSQNETRHIIKRVFKPTLGGFYGRHKKEPT